MSNDNFTPREIVSELDRYIVGQSAAKRAVAIAMRNRCRSIEPSLREYYWSRTSLLDQDNDNDK